MGQKSQVYGPSTAQIRRFLVRLAGLGAEARSEIVGRYMLARDGRAFALAESAMGLAIEQGGRTDARDAVAGPLLQLVRRPDAPTATDEPLATLDPVAEPALAALLALLVSDLLSREQVNTLYAPCEPYIPRTEIGGPDNTDR